MAVFVATVAPEGWELGRWEQKSLAHWQETKLTSSGQKQGFDVQGGPSTPGSRLLRLRMTGSTTQVLILENSALIFVNGDFLGEIIGYWESPYAPPGAAPPPGPPPVPAGRGSIGGDEAWGAQKSAPPPPMPMRRDGGSFAQGGPMHQKSANPQQAYTGQQESPLGMGMGVQQMPPAQPAAPNPRPKKPDNLDNDPVTAQKLLTAARAGEADVVSRVLAARADPDCQDADGKTALYVAAAANKLQVVEILLRQGADANLGKDGNTPMTVAYQKGNKKVLQALFNSTFQTLEREVGPGAGPSPMGGSRGFGRRRYPTSPGGEAAPDNAHVELVEATGRLVKISKTRKKNHFMSLESEGSMETGKSREDGVKSAMMSLVRAQKGV